MPRSVPIASRKNFPAAGLQVADKNRGQRMGRQGICSETIYYFIAVCFAADGFICFIFCCRWWTQRALKCVDSQQVSWPMSPMKTKEKLENYINIGHRNLFLGCAVDFQGCCLGYFSHCLQQLGIFPPLLVASASQYVWFCWSCPLILGCKNTQQWNYHPKIGDKPATCRFLGSCADFRLQGQPEIFFISFRIAHLQWCF